MNGPYRDFFFRLSFYPHKQEAEQRNAVQLTRMVEPELLEKYAERHTNGCITAALERLMQKIAWDIHEEVRR